jgi:hypothetical protein|nr:sialidase family protein [Kofleriaceae bacterium]
MHSDAFVGRRHDVERVLVCPMAGLFPVAARTAGGDIVVVFRTGAPHYGLSGTLATCSSSDGGRTWSDPRELAPRGGDVRNPALGVAPDGRWLVAYWRAGVRAYVGGAWRLPAPVAGDDDLFVVASSDRGATWSEPRAVRSALHPWASPFGRIVALADGALAMAVYGPEVGGEATAFSASIVRSRDGGATWGEPARVLAGASELSLCVLPDARVVGAVRRLRGDVAIVTSGDHGATWSEPVVATRTDEHPADLTVLRGSGALLLTFGRRRRPLGCGALVSRDAGVTWDRDREVLLAGDGVGNDVGYPSTVQLDDGTVVTVAYFAKGSAGGEPPHHWGDTTCQAIRYGEQLVTG